MGPLRGERGTAAIALAQCRVSLYRCARPSVLEPTRPCATGGPKLFQTRPTGFALIRVRQLGRFSFGDKNLLRWYATVRPNVQHAAQAKLAFASIMTSRSVPTWRRLGHRWYGISPHRQKTRNERLPV